MSTSSNRFRIATYNVHKCRGFDLKISPERIISVIHELQADIICLQEVVNAPDESRAPASPLRFRGSLNLDQAGEISRALPQYEVAFGANRSYRGGTYGNMTLTRLKLMDWRNHDVSRARRERRGVLETEIDWGNGITVHVFNVHLGTGHMERRFQAKQLVDARILTHSEFKGPRLIIGDFNEWTRGLTTRLLRNRFQTIRPRHAARFPRTFPGMLPLLSLDHCYFEPPLEVEGTRLWRSRTALIASDHLPLVADFQVGSTGR